MVAETSQLASCGHVLDQGSDKLGSLRTSTDLRDDVSSLRGRMSEDGYLYFPKLLEHELVVAARRCVLEQLDREGQLDTSKHLMEGSPRQGVKLFFQPELAQKNNVPLQQLLYAPNGRLMRFFADFLGGTVRHFDFTWLRCISPGPGTPSHCDIVFMGRGTRKLYTAWVPLGEIDLEMGGLMVLEGSHKNRQLRETYGARDVDSFCVDNPNDPAKTANGYNGWLSEDPNKIRKSLGGRWLVSDYGTGDVVVFCMDLVHGGLDNRTNRLRLSSDSRYQLESEPADERWIGDNPPGHSAAGKRGRVC